MKTLENVQLAGPEAYKDIIGIGLFQSIKTKKY